MILICVGGLIGTGCLVAPFYMVALGLQNQPGIYFDCSLLFWQLVLRLYRYIVGIRRDGWRCVNGGCRRAGRVSCSSSWRRRFWRLFRRQNLTVVDSTNFAAIVADTTLFEHIQHLLWTTCQVFLLAAIGLILSPGRGYAGRGVTRRGALRTSSTQHGLLLHFNVAARRHCWKSYCGAQFAKTCRPGNVKRLRTCAVRWRHHAGTGHQTGTGRFH